MEQPILIWLAQNIPHSFLKVWIFDTFWLMEHNSGRKYIGGNQQDSENLDSISSDKWTSVISWHRITRAIRNLAISPSKIGLLIGERLMVQRLELSGRWAQLISLGSTLILVEFCAPPSHTKVWCPRILLSRLDNRDASHRDNRDSKCK